MLSFGTAVVAIICLAILCVVESIYRWWKTSKGKRRIPCDPTIPIFGNSLSLVKATNLSELRDILFTYQRDSPLSGAWVFDRLIIMVNEPRYIEELSIKLSYKPEEIYGIFENVAKGIFIRNGEKWAKLRNPVNKLMHTKFTDRWMKIFSKKANDLCKIIASQEGIVELDQLCYQCTFDIVSETHLGVENSNNIKGRERFYGFLRKCLENAFMEPLQLQRKFKFFSSRLNDESLVRQVCEIVDSIINERRRVLKSYDSMNAEPANYSDVVLQVAEEEGLNEKETIGLAIDMLIAGSDTTSTAISCAIQFLAIHPEYQEKVEYEQYEIFNGSQRVASVEDLNKMKYLDMVIHETLRHCGVPLVARRLKRDVELDGYRLPSNSILIFRLMNVCRDPRWWEKPSDFFPEHFLAEAVAARPKGTFSPFSRGPRSCPAKLYAMISMKAILSVVLRRFKFTTDFKFEDIKYEYGFMQVPVSLNVKAHAKEPKSTHVNAA